jgi:hypothetical protein
MTYDTAFWAALVIGNVWFAADKAPQGFGWCLFALVIFIIERTA